MTLVGAASGAADVAANALAGLAEQRSGHRVITISHAVFSSFVVIGSLGTGALHATGADVLTVFATAGALMTVAGAAALFLGDGPHPASPANSERRRDGLRLALPFVAVGVVGVPVAVGVKGISIVAVAVGVSAGTVAVAVGSGRPSLI